VVRLRIDNFFTNVNSCQPHSLGLAFVTLKKIIDNKRTTYYSAFTFVLDQSRLWKFGELYGKTVTE
jgi:hypothetical protein